MARTAIIDPAGNVINIVPDQRPDLPTQYPGCSQLADDSAQVGWQWDGGSFLAPPSARKVPKSLIVQRLIDAGKIAAANAALEADPAKKARWYAADHPAIHADDPEAIAFLQAIGADPVAILAP